MSRQSFCRCSIAFSFIFLVLTSCGSITRTEKRRLESVGRDYASTTKGEARSVLVQRLGQPEHKQKDKDTWEVISDESNGERLVTFYDRSQLVSDGQHSTWRGDRHGWIRWRRELDYYLRSPATLRASSPVLKRQYAKIAF